MVKNNHKEKQRARYDKAMSVFSLDVEVWTTEFYGPIVEQLTALRNEKKLRLFDIESFIPLTEDVDDRVTAYENYNVYLKAIKPDETIVLKLLTKMGQPKPVKPKMHPRNFSCTCSLCR